MPSRPSRIEGTATGTIQCSIDDCEEVFEVTFTIPYGPPIRHPERPKEIIVGLLARETPESHEARIAHLHDVHGLH